jgi:pilus assembly protein CpaF
MDLKERIRQIFVSQHSHLLAKCPANGEEYKKCVTQIIEGIVSRPRRDLTEEERKKIVSDLVDEFTGLGPVETLMKDPAVTEIMINGPQKVYMEKNGRKELTGITMTEQQLMALVYKILSPTRRHVDEMSPYTDVAFKDGSRINIIIPPLALDGATVTIRKFLKQIRKVEDLLGFGTLDKRMADFLVACVKAKVNIMFAGATGAGKTTTVDVLSSYLPNDERILTIEDTAELRLSQEHVVRLEAKQPNIEGKGEITIRDLFRNSLRMRPDRIILGEIRGAEALDMLQAMCSGHNGSLAVIHANSPAEVIYRIETMILTSGVLITLEAIHRQIAAGLNLIVQHEQLVDGSRKITNITQVDGLKDGQVVLEDLFTYNVDSVTPEGKVYGRWIATGATPAFHPLFKKAGVDLPAGIFNKD